MRELRGNIVIKIGGSLLFTDHYKINATKISEFCSIIKSNMDFDRLIIVCGGGLIAREYINIIRSFTSNETLCDIFGIEISRINSKLIITFLKESAYPLVPKSMNELSKALLFDKIIVMGGLQPGQSTTTVATEVAEFINATHIIILTDVAGIYDRDPKKFPEAKLFSKLNYNELHTLILKSKDDRQAAAGEYRIFDLASLQILKRSNLEAVIMSGRDLNEFAKFWRGKKDILRTVISNK